MRAINKIILHCSATPEGRHTTVEDIRLWHKQRGWSDIGYHYVVYLDGTVHEGRPIERSGAHVKSYNKNSIGICYIGGVDKNNLKAKDTRTPEQIMALDLLIGSLLDDFKGATLHGHNEFANKACPSFDVQDEYRYLIDCYA
jgi:N-acetylmuramoyl-L-alanine amidase